MSRLVKVAEEHYVRSDLIAELRTSRGVLVVVLLNGRTFRVREDRSLHSLVSEIEHAEFWDRRP